jgi:hypothetical protein
LAREFRSGTVELELFSIRVDPDGLARITVRRLGEPVSHSWLVPAKEAAVRTIVPF